jgi:catechol 2,3-dioxygenase-like lactoylglutathione lyase family enzyme
MADWKREIGAITLYVPDLAEARKFYADAFGLDAQPADDDTAMLRF